MSTRFTKLGSVKHLTLKCFLTNFVQVITDLGCHTKRSMFIGIKLIHTCMCLTIQVSRDIETPLQLPLSPLIRDKNYHGITTFRTKLDTSSGHNVTFWKPQLPTKLVPTHHTKFCMRFIRLRASEESKSTSQRQSLPVPFKWETFYMADDKPLSICSDMMSWILCLLASDPCYATRFN